MGRTGAGWYMDVSYERMYDTTMSTQRRARGKVNTERRDALVPGGHRLRWTYDLDRATIFAFWLDDRAVSDQLGFCLLRDLAHPDWVAYPHKPEDLPVTPPL